MKTRQLTLNSMLAAMCAVLGYLSVDLGNFKFTFEGVPVLIAALIFGPIDGMLVGGIGILVYQLLRYGIAITTPLWVLPYIIAAAVAGIIAKGRRFDLPVKSIIPISLLFGVILTILNTVGIYIDSIIGGYYSKAYVFGSLGTRFIVCFIKYTVIGILLPTLLTAAGKAVKKLA